VKAQLQLDSLLKKALHLQKVPENTITVTESKIKTTKLSKGHNNLKLIQIK